MGTTKSSVFNSMQNKLATIAKAIGHPARVAIVEYLLQNDTCICNDLVEVIPLSQSTISQHLRELKEAGIIKGEIEGPKMNYCIDEMVWEEAKLLISDMFNSYSPKKKNCC